MSDVETLLSVDKGHVPAGVVVFRPRDPEAEVRRIRRWLGVIAGAATVAVAIVGAGREPVAMLALVTAMLAISATGTETDPEEARHKRPAMVLTAMGMIVRDASGLRTWQYDDIVDVRTCVFQGQVGIVVVLQNGQMHFVDNLLFARGEHVSGLIRRHLQPRGT